MFGYIDPFVDRFRRPHAALALWQAFCRCYLEELVFASLSSHILLAPSLGYAPALAVALIYRLVAWRAGELAVAGTTTLLAKRPIALLRVRSPSKQEQKAKRFVAGLVLNRLQRDFTNPKANNAPL